MQRFLRPQTFRPANSLSRNFSFALNKVILFGFLGSDVPPVKVSSNGNPYVLVSVGVPRRAPKDAIDAKNEVDFLPVQLFGHSAKFAEKYLKKGALITVEGSLRQNKWTDEHGNNQSRLNVVAQSIQAVPRGNRNSEKELENDIGDEEFVLEEPAFDTKL